MRYEIIDGIDCIEVWLIYDVQDADAPTLRGHSKKFPYTKREDKATAMNDACRWLGITSRNNEPLHWIG